MNTLYIQRHNRVQGSRSEGGYTLFIALIVASIVLTLSVSIAGFVRQQLILSGFSEESELAFYAADAGFECSQFLDLQGTFDVPHSGLSINCLGETAATGGAVSGQNQVFEIDWLSDDRDVCSIIIVNKTTSAGAVATEITANGYNTACDDIEDNPEVVERSILYTY